MAPFTKHEALEEMLARLTQVSGTRNLEIRNALLDQVAGYISSGGRNALLGYLSLCFGAPMFLPKAVRNWTRVPLALLGGYFWKSIYFWGADLNLSLHYSKLLAQLSQSESDQLVTIHNHLKQKFN